MVISCEITSNGLGGIAGSMEELATFGVTGPAFGDPSVVAIELGGPAVVNDVLGKVGVSDELGTDVSEEAGAEALGGKAVLAFCVLVNAELGVVRGDPTAIGTVLGDEIGEALPLTFCHVFPLSSVDSFNWMGGMLSFICVVDFGSTTSPFVS